MLTGRINRRDDHGGKSGARVGGPIAASPTHGGVDVELTRVAARGSARMHERRHQAPPAGDAKATISASITKRRIGLTEIAGMSVETTHSSDGRREARLNGGGPSIRSMGTNGGIQIGPEVSHDPPRWF